MKKFLAILVSLALVFALVACDPMDTPGENGADDKTVGLIVSTLNNPFFVDLETVWKMRPIESVVSM